ncbi:MAG: hypothetical protein B6D61_11900 [Bacteroidetes bacterium 4484_249]|nr:MAG: hypothetical protein B6D61_11900 [Bacteroidetes bacterium 4484_249]
MAIRQNYKAVIAKSNRVYEKYPFKLETGTRKSVFLTMITTYGVQQIIHSTGLIQNELQMDDLFRPIL